MIELPDVIVIYPLRKSVPSYLLCWIPAKEYERVVADTDKRRELGRLEPGGIEIELSDDGLNEAGVALDVPPERLRRAYLDLLKEDLVPETGMVELASLKEYLGEEESRTREEIVAELVEQRSRFEELDEGDLFRKIASPPPMTAGDKASKVYRRLDVKQRPTDEGDQGG
jgi:hypothetical protein